MIFPDPDPAKSFETDWIMIRITISESVYGCIPLSRGLEAFSMRSREELKAFYFLRIEYKKKLGSDPSPDVDFMNPGLLSAVQYV